MRRPRGGSPRPRAGTARRILVGGSRRRAAPAPPRARRAGAATTYRSREDRAPAGRHRGRSALHRSADGPAGPPRPRASPRCPRGGPPARDRMQAVTAPTSRCAPSPSSGGRGITAGCDPLDVAPQEFLTVLGPSAAASRRSSRSSAGHRARRGQRRIMSRPVSSPPAPDGDGVPGSGFPGVPRSRTSSSGSSSRAFRPRRGTSARALLEPVGPWLRGRCRASSGA
jgi:hypothetical protein